MDLAGWRDIALMVIALLYAIVTLVVGAVAFVVWMYGRRGLGWVDTFLNEKVRPALDAAEQQLVLIRDRTAALPGNLSLGAGEAGATPKRAGLPSLPFRKKKRRFPLLPS